MYYKRMSRFNLTKAGELRSLVEARSAQEAFYFQKSLWHVYLKLKFEEKYEKASCKGDAKVFLGNVGRAGYISELVAKSHAGMVSEVQGSMIHIVLPNSSDIRQFAGELHIELEKHLGNTKVGSWVMSAQSGLTLLVDAPGIHGDNSIVSLGNAANSAAKHLYKQLAITNEESRELKQNHIAIYEGSWRHLKLDDLVIITNSRTKERRILFEDVIKVEAHSRKAAVLDIHAQAAPLENGGSPSNDNPSAYFGWTMRADLDGFTKRVKDCRDDPQAMLELAQSFRSIMYVAKDFADKHESNLVQLPWAGDNFTAAVVFDKKDDYEEERPRGTVEFSLDFDDAMHEQTQELNLNGWAQAVGGDTAHGNANGNIYIGSVSFDDRRFLIATGIGVGYTLQAFVDVEIDVKEVAIYAEDYNKLTEYYKAQFSPVAKHDGSISTLFRKALLKDLERERKEHQSLSDDITQAASKSQHLNSSETFQHQTRSYFGRPH